MAAAARKTVLFVCTGNAGRSQIAAALFARLAGSGVDVVSAGVDPWTALHPVGRRLLERRGVDTAGLRPKHVRTFADAPVDVVVTIGDRAGRETPRLGRNPVRIHWDIADPADADGTGREEESFRAAAAQIEARLADVLSVLRGGACPDDPRGR